MNKFLTFAGTQPVYLGDIDFMQNSVLAAFSQLAKALMDSDDDSLNAILQGVEITHLSESQVSYSNGVVVLNGEILPVEGAVIAATYAQELYLHVDSVLSGNRTFKDGNSHQCYATRRAVLNTESSGGVALSSINNYHVPSDDAVYTDSVGSGWAKSGVLTRKNGMWLLVADILYNNVSQDEGILYFGVSEAHRDMFTNMDFPVSMVLTDQDDSTTYIYSAIMSIIKSSNEVSFHIKPVGDNIPLLNSAGELRVFIPILQ